MVRMLVQVSQLSSLPELKNKVELDEVELVLPIPAMSQRHGSNSFVSSNETKDDTKQLSERQSIIIQLIQENETITKLTAVAIYFADFLVIS